MMYFDENFYWTTYTYVCLITCQNMIMLKLGCYIEYVLSVLMD